MVRVVQTITKIAPLCVVCGKKATLENTLKLPSCALHENVPTEIPICPNCDAKMILKNGKNGALWSCPDYPTCYGTRNIVAPMEDPDIL